MILAAGYMCQSCGLVYEWRHPSIKHLSPKEFRTMYPNQQQPYAPQPQPQQQYAQPPVQNFMPGAAAHIHQQATQNVMMDIMKQPIRQPQTRNRIDDGTHHIHLTKVEMKPSQKDNRVFLLWEFTVVASTVASNVGQQYSYPMFWDNRYALQDLADIGKEFWGHEQAVQFTAQGMQADDMAYYLAQQLTGKFCKLVARRNTKNNQSYHEAFINHTFREFRDQQNQLAPLPQTAAPHIAPQPQQGQFPPQGAPQPQQAPFPPQGAPQPQQGPFPPQPQGAPQPQQGQFPPQGAPQPQQAPFPPQGAPQPQQAPFPPQGAPQPQQGGFPPPHANFGQPPA